MSGQPPTLRARVSLLALLVIAGWLVLLAAGFDYVLSSRLDKQIESTLRIRTQAATATVIVRDHRVVGVRDSSTDSELDSSIWVFSGSRVIARPDVARPLDRTAEQLAGAPENYTDQFDHRFYVQPVVVDGRRAGSVVAAIDLDPYERTKTLALVASGVLAVLLLAGAYPVLRFATGRALRPVDRMTRQAAEWSVNSPAERFGAHQRYAELSSLAGTLDELLDRLAAVLRHERHLSAELSHELRTPLARVCAQADLLLDGARPDQRAELEALRDNCTAMDAIIDTLLAAARTDLVRTVGRCALRDVFAVLADASGPPVTVADTELTVGVEADVAARVLAPVLENARRYATTSIRCAARATSEGVVIDVSNDGPRIAPEIAEQVFEPGFRGADDEHDGAGLGLALARRLARAADGDLVVDTQAPDTTFRVLLPAG